MKHIFVDVGLNTVARVNAPTLDEAWKKYIDHRINKLPQPERATYYGPNYEFSYNDVREDLEHDVFVVSEDAEVTEIG